MNMNTCLKSSLFSMWKLLHDFVGFMCFFSVSNYPKFLGLMQNKDVSTSNKKLNEECIFESYLYLSIYFRSSISKPLQAKTVS